MTLSPESKMPAWDGRPQTAEYKRNEVGIFATDFATEVVLSGEMR